MPRRRSTTPQWHGSTLRRKAAAHKACFADILRTPLAAFSDGKFEILADECFEDHWLSYEADCRDSDSLQYVGLRHYFVDAMLGLAVTTRDEQTFITYFHEDFDRPHGVRPPRNASLGQRQLEYRHQLDIDRKTTKVKSLKFLTT